MEKQRNLKRANNFEKKKNKVGIIILRDFDLPKSYNNKKYEIPKKIDTSINDTN